MSATRARKAPGSSVLPPLVALAACSAAAVASAEQGYGHAPFRDEPVAVMQAATLEMLVLPGGTEVLEDAAALYAASLEEEDPELARRVREAIDAGPLPRTLADAALAALAPEVNASALRAAVAARLLLSETGLAERYEDMAEEGTEEEDDEGYGYARAALARAATIVTALAPHLPPEDRDDAERLLGRLAALLPEDPALRPAAPPEAAETLAQGLVALLERAADADLYIDRDLAGALATVRRLAGEGCGRADAALGGETLAIAARYHEEALADPLALLAPAAQSRAEAAYAALADAPEGPACAQLLVALDEARRTLYPERAR